MKNLSQIEWQDAVEKNKNTVVIDVRTMEECRMGMIENAIRLDITQTELFIEEIQKMDKSKDFYLYCAAGGGSGTTCTIMNELGFENVFNLTGGFSCWYGNTMKNAG